MKITPLASGSSGNCYIVDWNGPVLLLEAGLRLSEIQQGLWEHDLKLSDVDFCLVSHLHQDHSKAAKDLVNRGITVSMPHETAEKMDFGAEIHRNQARRKYEKAGISIWPFETPHGDATNHAYLAKAGGDELLFYATDGQYIPVLPEKISHLMIEVNYVEKRLDQATLEGESSIIHAKKSIQTHMSLETLLKYLDKLDQSKLRKIYLLHLSSEFADPEICKEEVQRKMGVEVYIA